MPQKTLLSPQKNLFSPAAAEPLLFLEERSAFWYRSSYGY